MGGYLKGENMSIESGPSIPEKKEDEFTPEEEELLKQNPELGQVSMIEGGVELIKEGQETNEPEKIKQGLEVLESVKEEILTPSGSDSKRASKLKRVVNEILKDFLGEHGPISAGKDIGSFFQEIKGAKPGNRRQDILGAANRLSKKQGVLHLLDDIKRGLEE